MINDLATSSGHFDRDMMKYADDTNVSEYISNDANNISLQEVTDSIVDWSLRNKLIPQNVKNLLYLSNETNQTSLPTS